MTNSLLPLVGRIEQSSEDLEAIVSRAETLVDKYRVSLDDGYLDGVALNLHTFYSATVQNNLSIFIDFIIRLNKVPDND